MTLRQMSRRRKTTIGDRIRRTRELRGISQAQFAKHFDVQQSHVWKWESGMRVPRLSTLMRMADYLDVTLDELVKGTGA